MAISEIQQKKTDFVKKSNCCRKQQKCFCIQNINKMKNTYRLKQQSHTITAKHLYYTPTNHKKTTVIMEKLTNVCKRRTKNKP